MLPVHPRSISLADTGSACRAEGAVGGVVSEVVGVVTTDVFDAGPMLPAASWA